MGNKKQTDNNKIQEMAERLRKCSDEKLIYLYTTVCSTNEGKQAYNIVLKERGLK
jgi:hypothetical protein